MHDDAAAIRIGRHAHHGGIGKARDVVDDRGARIDAGLGDRSMARIDADADSLVGKTTNDIHDARTLFFAGNLHRAGTRGFAADVDDLRAIVDQGTCVREGRIEVGMRAAVRKRVGRHVEHAHDDGRPGVERI